MFFYGLPEYSRSKTVIAMDEEIAKLRVSALTDEELEEIYQAQARGEASQIDNVTPRGYTLEIEKLNQVLDALNGLSTIVLRVAGNKVGRDAFKPAPRPKTAYDVELDKRLEEFEEKYQADTLAEFGF